MKHFVYILCIAVLSSIVTPAMGQWTKTTGPEGGYVNVIYDDPTSGYIFTGGNGFYRSTNNGTTWNESSTGMTGDASPIAVVRAGSKLYAVSLDRLYISNDNGDSWTQSSANVPAQALSMIAVGGTIVVGTNVFGVYWTTNDGASWTAGTGFQPANNIVQTFVFQGTRLLAGLGGKKIWASNDTGKTWAAFGSGTGFGASHTAGSLALHGSKIFAACSDSAVFVSTDGGANWTHSATGMNPRAMVSKVVSNGSELYAYVAGAYTGVDTGVVYRSTNDGASWVSVRSDLYSTHGYTLGFGTGKVFFSNWAGIYASTDQGGHWLPSNTGLRNVGALSLTVNGSTLFAGHAGGIAKTEDEGTTWTVANNGVPGNTAISGMTTHDSYVFAGSSNGVLRSNDNGASWVPMNNGLTGFALSVSVLASGGSSVYAGTFEGVYVSTDNGGTWTGPGTGFPSFSGVNTIFVDGADLWAASGSNGIYHSTDNGATWTDASNGLPAFSRSVSAITRSGSILFAGLMSSTTGYVYTSTDNGANWTSSSSGIPANSLLSDLYSIGQFVFAGFSYTGLGNGIYRTSDNGANWVAVSEGLPDPSGMTRIIAMGTNLYGGSLGVWKRPLSQVTDVREISDGMPMRFGLEQNYPNPFNPTTSMSFQVVTNDVVSLKIYDVLGREVATIVNQELHPGTYQVSWDASSQPSGVYYYRLQAGIVSETKKMLLVK